MNSKKYISLFIIIPILSVILAALGVEILFRLYGAARGIDLRLYVTELTNSERLPDIMFRTPFQPNMSVLATTSDFSVVYTNNSKGLRDKEYSYDRGSDQRRIVLLGDSFTFGEGIPYGERYSDIIENRSNIEIVTAGWPGMGLSGIVQFALSEAPKYHPDAIMIAMNNLISQRGETDITHIFDEQPTLADIQASTEKPYETSSTSIRLPQYDPFFHQDQSIFVKHSYALSYLRYLYVVQSLHNRMAQEDRLIWELETKGTKLGVGEGELRNQNLTERTTFLLYGLASYLTSLDIPLILVNIDDTPIVTLPPALPLGVTYYDLSSELHHASKNFSLRFTYDQHYNKRTNALIADLLEERLRADGW